MKLDLTVAVPVRNEEKNLPMCLQAIGVDFAQSIFVIDSGSTDATAEVARSHGAQLIDFEWDGYFPKKRNWFLRYHTPRTKWVLFHIQFHHFHSILPFPNTPSTHFS